MTPKEKAEDLHTKMYFIISNNGQFTGEHSIPHKWEEAKKCALIAVDEVMSYMTPQTDSKEAFDYWRKVKIKIEKL